MQNKRSVNKLKVYIRQDGMYNVDIENNTCEMITKDGLKLGMEIKDLPDEIRNDALKEMI